MMVRRSLPRPSKSVAGKPFSRPHDDLAAYLHVQSLVTLPFDCANNEASAVLFSRRTALCYTTDPVNRKPCEAKMDMCLGLSSSLRITIWLEPVMMLDKKNKREHKVCL
jgi:hypothetical protein